MKIKKIVLKIMLFIMIVTLYLNVGWALGTYYHNNILSQSPQTISQVVAKGAWQFMVNNHSLKENQTDFMVIWPVLIFFVLGSWIIFGFYYFLWLVFASGVAKIFGIG